MTKQINHLTTGDKYTLPIGTVEIIDIDPRHGRRFRALINGQPTYVAFSTKTVEVN